MLKSAERLVLEAEIRYSHGAALAVALKMVADEFAGDVKAAIADGDFARRMQAATRAEQQRYLLAYEKLEDLEAREGFPAMKLYAAALEMVACNLSWVNRRICYYPFSGTDFYWARIFRILLCEDIGFGRRTQSRNMWWDAASYGARKRQEIIRAMEEAGVLSAGEGRILRFIRGDAEAGAATDYLNMVLVTLLVKGGHDVTGFLSKRFGGRELRFGAILTASAANPLDEIVKYLEPHSYRLAAHYEPEEFLAPYAMELRDINVFLKE